MADSVEQSTGPCSKCQGIGVLRRNLCSRCYDNWLRQRPVGIGASCAGCGDRRRVHLQYVELRQGFAVVCRNCAAELALVRPADEEEIRVLVQRDRRSLGEPERRGEDAPSAAPDQAENRRQPGRRQGFAEGKHSYRREDSVRSFPQQT